jgi:hypothetical protein
LILSGTSSHLRKRLSRLDGLVMDESIRTLRLSNVCSLIVDIEPRVAQSDLLELLRHLREKGNMAAQYAYANLSSAFFICIDWFAASCFLSD